MSGADSVANNAKLNIKNSIHITLIGPPGAGKGTQGQQLSEHLQIPKISTGDMLRLAITEQSSLGKKAQNAIESGHLVSDDIIIPLIKDRIDREDCNNGFILDGFPRTLMQAKSLQDTGIIIDFIIAFTITDQEIVNRLSERLIHLNSGRIYHLRHSPPKQAGIDDITGEQLVQREDDKAEVVLNRLKIYRQETKAILDWYKKISRKSRNVQYLEVDATLGIKKTQDYILQNIINFSYKI